MPPSLDTHPANVRRVWSIGQDPRAKYHVKACHGRNYNGDTQGGCGRWFVQFTERADWERPPQDQCCPRCWRNAGLPDEN